MADANAEWAELLPETSTLPQTHSGGLNVVRLLRLRAPLMVGIFLLLAVPLLAIILVFVPSYYVATANIEFSQAQPTILDERGAELSGSSFDSYVTLQAQLLRGYPILKRVLANEDIQKLPLSQQDDALQFLMKHTESDIDPQTQLVTLEYRDVDPNIALQVLKIILAEYKEYTFERETSQGEFQRRVLEGQRDEIIQDLNKQLEKVRQMRLDAGLPMGAKADTEPLETEQLRINLTQAQADYTTATTALKSAERVVEQVHSLVAQNEQNPDAPIYAQGVEDHAMQSPSLVPLMEQLALAQQEFSTVSENYVEGQPQVEMAREKVASLQRRVNEERNRARRDALGSVLEQAQSNVELRSAEVRDAEERRDQFQALLNEYQQKNLDRSADYTLIAEQERLATNIQGHLERINDRLLNLQIESNAPARATVGEPVVSDRPDYMRKIKYALLALVAAAGIAVGLGVLRELSDQTVRSAQDVAYITSLPVLATIPHSSEDRLPESVNVATVSEDYPSSMTTDEFRHVVARIINSVHGGHPIKTCVVTSPARGDGKSTLSCNMALILAQADRRVLLVDVDSRNPSVERYFGLKTGAGLSEMLNGQQLPHDPDRVLEFESLYIMGPGLNSADLVERLASPEMRDFLESAEELFDHIILDTPATLLTSETRLLTHLADAIIVVVGAGVSTSGMLRRCLNALEASGGVLLGVVVNAVRQAPGGYLRRNIESYYSHKGNAPRDRKSPAPGSRVRRGEPSIVLVNEEESRSDQ